ncbi:MAG TPA: bifunctional 5,10-methylenetetrahydrofolate dehydrogenase/5,10-methenyltetrahydrofolate cyclohydrolase [Patescibacteria group bacterium]
MNLLYGKPIADDILGRLKGDIFLHEEKPGLAVVLVGADKASQIYVSLKGKRAEEIGMKFSLYELAEDVSEEELLDLIARLNVDGNIHGMIVQLPLPQGLDAEKIISAIDPQKDADGFLGMVGYLEPVFPRAILKMIKSAERYLTGKKAVVVANSDEFGKTMCQMLAGENIAPEYILVADLASNLGKIKEADVVVSAVGSPGLLRGEMFKEGAIVIDGGIEKVGQHVLGDVDFASTEGKSGFLTPVPGGVGPVTIACLLENVYLAFEAQQKEK